MAKNKTTTIKLNAHLVVFWCRGKRTTYIDNECIMKYGTIKEVSQNTFSFQDILGPKLITILNFLLFC